MCRRALFLALSFLLLVGTTLQAGALVSLVPYPPVNGVAYEPNEIVNVRFYVQLDANSPPTIRTRLLQFDFADSSPGLIYVPEWNHPLADIGPIPFWNLNGAHACANDQSQCGNNYFIDADNFSFDRGIVSLTYFGFTASDDLQVILRQASPTLVGSLNVILPPVAGDYILDVLNADNADPNRGAQLWYGFGISSDPEYVILRANTGGVVMSPDSGPGTDELGRVSFAVVPEPTALALLGVGAAFILQARKKRRIPRRFGSVLAQR